VRALPELFVIRFKSVHINMSLVEDKSLYNFGALVLHTEDPVWFPYKGGEDPEVR
jgi:hypothetical protein